MSISPSLSSDERLSPQEFVRRIHRYTPRLWATHLLVGANLTVFSR